MHETCTLQQLSLQLCSSCCETLLLADAANIPGIDDMRVTAESSDFSSMSGLSSSTHLSASSSCDSSVGSSNTGGSDESNVDSEEAQSIVGMDASQSADESFKPDSIIQDDIKSEGSSVTEEEADAESDMPQEYVYPAYLREGAGRDFLALSLDMRAANPNDRPSWSAVLRRLREAGTT